jgi:hypothetical protein
MSDAAICPQDQAARSVLHSWLPCAGPDSPAFPLRCTILYFLGVEPSGMLIDTTTNNAALAEMLGVIKDGDPLGFAGVGVSRPLGYPTWPGLIKMLADETRTHSGSTVTVDGETLSVDDVERFSDLLLSAKIFKSALGHRYFAVMRTIFGPRGPRPASVSNLLSLPFRHIFTSNYDPALDPIPSPLRPGNPVEILTLNQGQALKDFLVHLGDRSYGRRVVHVHGRYDDPNSLILTEDDYMRLYSESNVASFFWNIITVRERCVFFGFSFSDLDMLHGFRSARNILGTGRHFALMPMSSQEGDAETPKRSQIRLKYGVTPVFFDPIDEAFSGYETSLSRIAQEIAVEVPNLVSAPGAEFVPAPTPKGKLGVSKDVQRDVCALDALTAANISRYKTGELYD